MIGKIIPIKKEYSANEIVFLSTLFIYLIAAAFDLTMLGQMVLFQKISDVLKLFSMAVLGLNAIIHIKLYNKRQIIVFFLYGIVAVISTIKSGSMAPVLLLMFWANMRYVDFDEILVVFLIANSIVFVLTLILCAIKLIPDRVYAGSYHSMGFAYKNTTGMAYMSIQIAYLVLRKNKTKWYEYLIALVLSIIVFAGCKSKSALIMSVMTIIICILIQSGACPKSEVIAQAISTAIYPMLMLISLLSAIIPDYSVQPWQKINSLLTNRLQLGKSAFELYSIHPFGQHIEWIGVSAYSTEIQGSYNFVDSSYLSIPLNYGWIFALILVVAFSILNYQLSKKKEWYYVMILILFALHGFVESTLITISLNPALLAIGMLAFNSVSDREIGTVEYKNIIDCLKKNKFRITIIGIMFAVLFCFLNFNTGAFYQAGIIENSIVDPVKSTAVYAVIGLLFGVLIAVAVLIYNMLYKKKFEKLNG